MLSLPAYDTSGFSFAPQLSVTGKTKHMVFNFSPIRTSFDRKQLRQRPSSISKHNAALPISQIPIEILCDIFQKFLEDDREFPDYTPAAGPLVSFHSRADPTVLGQVCSWWRRVVISTPALWANILILEPKNSQILRTRLWLQRAGNHPLNLSIMESRGRGRFDMNSIRQILSLFISRLEIWRAIDFSLPVDALECLLPVTHNPTKCQKLESASLDIHSEEYAQRSTKPFTDAIWSGLHSSPALCRIHWWDAYLDTMPTHAPWSQITHISLNFEFDVETLLDVLSRCPQIQEVFILKLSSLSHLNNHTGNNDLILTNLHTLTLESTVETGPLFQRLTLPSLSFLNIRHRHLEGNVSRDVRAFHEFLSRSKCSLKIFTLVDQWLPEDQLNDFLTSPCLRSVTSLEVRSLVTNKIIESLTCRDDNGYHKVMPSLEEMKLWKCKTTDGLLSEMIVGRYENSSKTLKKLALQKVGMYETQDEVALTRMFNAGLKGIRI